MQGGWHRVCADAFPAAAARVACRMAGLPSTGAAKAGSGAMYTLREPSSQSEYAFFGVQCSGDESSLLQCTFSTAAQVCTTGSVSVTCGSHGASASLVSLRSVPLTRANQSN